MPGRIPMKGDPPTLDQIVEIYGDPLDKMAEAYFLYQGEAERDAAAGDVLDAAACREGAEQCRKTLAEYGCVPGRVDGAAKAVRPS